MILHVMILDKFLPPFIDFVKENFDVTQHEFVFVTSEKYIYGLTPEHNASFLHTDNDIFNTLLKKMMLARKIIVHGLWRDKTDQLLVSHAVLLKKTYWIMWGGDFYYPENQTELRKKIIKNVGYLVTKNSMDVDMVRKEYGATGVHVDCISYTSNVFPSNVSSYIQVKENPELNILVGNSATETNNHFECFDVLKKLGSKNANIFCPLSYGSVAYAQQVITAGTELFGARFIPMTEFMSTEHYLSFLSTIDIAFFNHKRQQAFGNIILLLGLGKKVYLNKNSNLNLWLEGLRIKVFDAEFFNFEPLDEQTRINNSHEIATNFSKHALIEDLNKILI